MSDSIKVTVHPRGLLQAVEVDTFRHISNGDLRFLAGCRDADPKWAAELARREAAGIDHQPSVDDMIAVESATERYLESRHA